MQTAAVILIVIASAAYAAWTLMPRRWQSALSRRMLGREPAAGGGCGACSDCGPAAAPGSTQVIRVQRRPPA